MPTLIGSPARIEAAGNKPKIIEEFIGCINTRDETVSIARTQSPGGWTEPGQKPDFDEFTIVLKGMLRVNYEGGSMEVSAGQAVITHREEWVQYSTPEEEGAEYMSICLPAFTPETVHRDEE